MSVLSVHLGRNRVKLNLEHRSIATVLYVCVCVHRLQCGLWLGRQVYDKVKHSIQRLC